MGNHYPWQAELESREQANRDAEEQATREYEALYDERFHEGYGGMY